MDSYQKDYFQWLQVGSLRSAKIVIPYVLDFIKPNSVVDIGCGVGTWLSVFQEKGVKDIVGIDGDYVDQNMLHIPQNAFIALDLTKPIKLNREFDLVVSLEVAEHLPIECAATFVETLTSLGSVILFSAAIPFQGGYNHFNEQWPEYWAALFKKYRYEAIDCIRSKIWNNNDVEWWYSQNILMYVNEDYLEKDQRLKKEFENTNHSQLSIVHPAKYLSSIEQ